MIYSSCHDTELFGDGIIRQCLVEEMRLLSCCHYMLAAFFPACDISQ